MRRLALVLGVVVASLAWTSPARRALYGAGERILTSVIPFIPPERVEAWGNRLERIRPANEREAMWSADEAYRLAERYYQATDFGGAEARCERALRLDPRHAPAQALRTEIRFITGKGPSPPSLPGIILHKNVVSAQQTLVEVDGILARAERHLEQGRLEAADREYRRDLEYLKWMPDGIEMRDRRARLESGRRILEVLRASKANGGGAGAGGGLRAGPSRRP